jgi:hypothetical protein
VRLRWLTHKVEVVLGLLVSLMEKKTKEFAVHTCKGASEGGHESDTVIVSVSLSVVLFVICPVSSFVEPGVSCLRV